MQKAPRTLARVDVRDAGVEGRVHARDPAIALREPDGKGRMPHAQTRMAALLLISIRASKAHDEEVGKALASAVEVVRGIEGCEQGLLGDAFVEGAGDGSDRVLADDGAEVADRVPGLHVGHTEDDGRTRPPKQDGPP